MAKDIEALTGVDKSDFRNVLAKSLGIMQPQTVPVVADFTWVNQGTATAVDNEGIYLSDQFSIGGMRCLVRNLPSTTFSAEMLFSTDQPTLNYFQCGMLLRESATGKLLVLDHIADLTIGTNMAPRQVLSAKYQSPTAWTADNYWWTQRLASHVRGFKITGDGSTTKAYVTFDQESWVRFGDLAPANNSFLTTAPDQVGFFINNNRNAGADATQTAGMKVKHFAVS